MFQVDYKPNRRNKTKDLTLCRRCPGERAWRKFNSTQAGHVIANGLIKQVVTLLMSKARIQRTNFRTSQKVRKTEDESETYNVLYFLLYKTHSSESSKSKLNGDMTNEKFSL